jgi:hypothetical protein
MAPAAVFAPETVAFPAELDISITPLEVIGALLVIVDELESFTVPALMAPVPVVFTVDAALDIDTSLSAVRVEVVFFV